MKWWEKVRGSETYVVMGIGEEEVQDNKVSVRSRNQGDLGAMNINGFLSMLDKEIREKS